MGAVKLQKKKYTLEEYYELQDKINTKGIIHDGENIRSLDFWDGDIVFMAGGTRNHGKIGTNLTGSVWQALKGNKCQPFNSDTGLAIDEYKTTLHPDLFVVCGEEKISSFDKEAITNPTVIFEVLSKSTELYDRNAKFKKYKTLDSFKEYILVSQHKPLIETIYKQGDNLWSFHEAKGLNNELHIRSLDIFISLNEIYKTVIFPKQEDED